MLSQSLRGGKYFKIGEMSISLSYGWLMPIQDGQSDCREGLLIEFIEQVLMTEADIHVNQGNHSPKKLS